METTGEPAIISRQRKEIDSLRSQVEVLTRSADLLEGVLDRVAITWRRGINVNNMTPADVELERLLGFRAETVEYREKQRGNMEDET